MVPSATLSEGQLGLMTISSGNNFWPSLFEGQCQMLYDLKENHTSLRVEGNCVFIAAVLGVSIQWNGHGMSTFVLKEEKEDLDISEDRVAG